MSWDIYIQDLPPDATSVRDIPDNFRPQPIGQRSVLIEKILEVFPNADFSDPSRGLIRGDGFSIVVGVGKEIVTSIALFVRGMNLEVVDLIERLLSDLNLRALDGGSKTGFFDAEASRSSFQQWVQYRDHVIGDQNISEQT